MLVMDVFTRRIIGFGVAPARIDGVSVCRTFNSAISGQPLPKHLSTDNDPLFRFHRWFANLPVLEIDEIKSVPYIPISHPFVERQIGTIRREYLDRTFSWNSVDLARKLGEFKTYYNSSRCHQSLRGGTPPGEIRQAGTAARFTGSVRLVATLPRTISAADSSLKYQFAKDTRKQQHSEYLQAYVERAQIGLDLKGWLFRTAVGRTGQLSERPMTQADVDAPERLSRGASAADLIRKAV